MIGWCFENSWTPTPRAAEPTPYLQNYSFNKTNQFIFFSLPLFVFAHLCANIHIHNNALALAPPSPVPPSPCVAFACSPRLSFSRLIQFERLYSASARGAFLSHRSTELKIREVQSIKMPLTTGGGGVTSLHPQPDVWNTAEFFGFFGKRYDDSIAQRRCMHDEDVGNCTASTFALHDGFIR